MQITDPDTLTVNGTEINIVKPEFLIIVTADDGTELLRIAQRDGKLEVTGPEDRWTEGAARFVAEVRRLLRES